MRLRTDSAIIAGWMRAHEIKGCVKEPCDHIAHDPKYNTVAPAQPGDVWRMYAMVGDEAPRQRIPIGYYLTCPEPGCDQGGHSWTHAYDCKGYGHCSIGDSCWTWTGSPEEGTLTASPSLFSPKPFGCGWHGYLRNGVMEGI